MKVLQAPAYIPDFRDLTGDILIFQSDDLVGETDDAFGIDEKVEVRFPDREGLWWTSLGKITEIDHSDLPFLLFVRVLWNSAVPLA